MVAGTGDEKMTAKPPKPGAIWTVIIMAVLKIVAPMAWGWFLRWLEERLNESAVMLGEPASMAFDPTGSQGAANEHDVRTLFDTALNSLGLFRMPQKLALMRCRALCLASIRGNADEIRAAETELELVGMTVHRNAFD